MTINFNSLNKGLALHLPLDQTHKNGAAIYSDLSAQSNHGTAVGSPTSTTDRFGVTDKALAFNGTNQYINLSSTDFLSKYAGDTKGSFSVWFKTSASGVTKALIGIGNNLTNNTYLSILTSYTNDKIGFEINNAGSTVVSILTANTYNDGNWHHMVVTSDGVTSLMYIDSVVEADTDSGEWLSSLTGLNTFRIGDLELLSVVNNFWNGSIDDVRYYSGRALSQAEVTALYQAGGIGNVQTNSLNKGLVLHLPLDKVHTKTGTRNLVTNGTFTTDTDWTKQTGWSINVGTGTADCSSGSTIALSQNNIFLAGHTYKISINTTSISSGAFQVHASFQILFLMDAVKKYSYVITVTNDSRLIVYGVGAVGSIDNVEIYDVTGTACDLSAQGNHGSMVGTTWATDRFGVADKALAFNGTSDYIQLPEAFNYQTFSIAFWVKFNTEDTTDFIIDGRDGSGDGVAIFRYGTGNVLYVTYNDVSKISTEEYTSSDGWIHIVGTAESGGELKLYINGVINGAGISIAGETIDVTALAKIGVRATNTSFLGGSLLDFRIYNRALTQAEVTALYQSFGPGNIIYTP